LKDKDYELWKVYARGLTGRVEGLIFRRFNIVPVIPGEARFIGYGLDFGFTNDPTSLIEVYELHGELWVNELIYETGMTNQDIGKEMNAIGIKKNREIIADSAEPKSIEEIGRMGFTVRGAIKGKDSVNNSIDILKRYRINITQRSLFTTKEFGGYRWKANKDGLLTNEPVGFNDHSIAALRYVALNKLAQKGQGKYSII
jgi:phage terminase large subunit